MLAMLPMPVSALPFMGDYRGMTQPISLRDEAIIAFHDGGKRSLQEVADEFGYTRQRVHQILAKHGVLVRKGRVLKARPPKVNATRERYQAIAAYYVEANPTQTLASVAKHFGVSIATVQAALRAMNIKARSHGWKKGESAQ